MQKKIAGLILALSTGNALALGLGEASGQAVFGQPLRVEIPLLGAGGNMPAASCFRVRAPVAEIGNEYVLRNSRIQVVAEQGVSKLIVTSAALVREPFVAFAVTAACGFELTKDYVLLAAFPTDAAPEVALPRPAAPQAPVVAAAQVAVAPATAPSAVPAVATAGVKPVAASASGNAAAAPDDKRLRIAADTTLEALAQQKYPLQPKAREKFMRMMAQANPELTSHSGAIAAGTELQVPPGLPQRRTGPYLGEGKPAAAARPAAPEATAPAADAAPTVRTAKVQSPGKDRLVLGRGVELSEAKLMAEAERLAAVLQEQTSTQQAVADNLAKLEASYGELQKRYGQLENRLNRVESERLAEKQAPQPASFDFVELILAIAAGGALGGLLLHGYQRLRQGRGQEPRPTPATPKARFTLPWRRAKAPAAPAGEPPAAAKSRFKFPWAKPKTPEAAVVATAALAAAAVAEAAPTDAEQVPAAEPPIPAFLRKETAVEVAPAAPEPEPEAEERPSLEFSLIPEPQAAAEPVAAEAEVAADEEPAEIAAAAEPEPDALESLSLDFPLAAPAVAAASEEPALALPTVDIPQEPTATLEPLTLDFPPILAAGGDAPAPALPAENSVPASASASALDSIALDFPEIPAAETPQPETPAPAGDPHVIEFEVTAKDAAQNTLDFRKS
ncbi:MAG: hypothetical protein HZC24_10810 [Rhodocyclales bacterium]|nr:hypothetical protein [Rhodocyclales bacterium]